MIRILAGIVALTLAIFAAAYALTGLSCWSNWSGTRYEYRFHNFSCQVKHPVMGWIPSSKFRIGY